MCICRHTRTCVCVYQASPRIHTFSLHAITLKTSRTSNPKKLIQAAPSAGCQKDPTTYRKQKRCRIHQRTEKDNTSTIIKTCGGALLTMGVCLQSVGLHVHLHMHVCVCVSVCVLSPCNSTSIEETSIAHLNAAKHVK
jgi:hypothetical protein